MKKFLCIILLLVTLPILGYSQNKKYEKMLDKYDVKPYLSSIQDKTAYNFWNAVIFNNPRLKKTLEASEKGKETFLKASQRVAETMDAAKLYDDGLSYVTDWAYGDTLALNLLSDLDVQKMRQDFNIKYYYDNEQNAMADPDANILISSGLLSTQDLDYYGLLGIVAHECAHTLLFHVMQQAYEEEEKLRKNQIVGAIAAGINVAAAGYAQANGAKVDWDDINETTQDLAVAAYIDAYGRFSFKYSREQEIEADIIAYRLLDWIGVGGDNYLRALYLVKDNDVVSNSAKDGDHPSVAYRIQLLEYMRDTRPM